MQQCQGVVQTREAISDYPSQTAAAAVECAHKVGFCPSHA